MEEANAANIHKSLMNTYGKTSLDTVRRLASGINGNPGGKAETGISDRLCSGRPAAAVRG